MKIYSIYRATNLITNKVYIGFDSKWPNRKKNHQWYALNGGSTYLYKSIRKHGWGNFKWDVLYQSYDGDHCLNVMEPHFILEYKSYGSGYNLTKGGEGLLGIWALKTIEEKNVSKKRMSDAQINRHLETTIEEKLSRLKKMADTNLNKSIEEKNAINKKRSYTKRNKSIEEKNAIGKKLSNAHHNRSKEKEEARCKKISDAYLNKSIEEKASRNKKQTEKVVCDIITKKEYDKKWAVRLGLLKN